MTKRTKAQSLADVSVANAIASIAGAQRSTVWTKGSIQAEDFQVMTSEFKRRNFANRVRFFAACCHTPILFQDSQDSQSSDVTMRIT